MSKLKQILAFVKANLILLLSVVVMVAALPTGLLLGMSKAAAIHKQVEQDLQQRLRSLNSAQTNYALPDLLGAGQTEFSRPPNKATNEAVARYMQAAAKAADEVYRWAVQWNSEDRPLLVEGLFPEPKPEEAARKLQEVAAAWPAAQRALLREFGAGAPPDPEVVLARLETRKEEWVQRAVDRGEEAEQAAADPDLRRALTELRHRLYVDRAQSLTFYASDDVFVAVAPWSSERPPSLDVAWDWQHRTWMHRDILKALALANTDQAGVRLSVLDGPVKRIESIAVAPWTYEGTSQPRPINPAAPVPLNFEASFTGLAGPNPLFDVRYATISVIVDSARIPEVLDAFAATNLMTVIDQRIESYDPAQDLAEGYVYGLSSPVRLQLRIETLWMRQWTAPLMPPKVRAALGVPSPQPAQQRQGAGS